MALRQTQKNTEQESQNVQSNNSSTQGLTMEDQLTQFRSDFIEGNTDENDKTSSQAKKELEYSQIQGGKGPIQREAETASWTPPYAGATATYTNEEVIMALLRLKLDLMNLREEMPEGSDSAPLLELETEIQEYGAHFGSLAGSEMADSFYLRQLQGSFNEDYNRVYRMGLNEVRTHKTEQLGSLQHLRVMPPLSPENLDGLRAAFAAGSEGSLSQIGSFISSIENYNSKINQYAGYLRQLGSAIRGAATIERIHELTENAAPILERAGQVITALQATGEILRISGGASSEAVQAIDDLEAQFQLIDLGMNFASAVPILGQLWSTYYSPAIEFCINGLRRIAEARAAQAHDLVEIQIQSGGDLDTAPRLGSAADFFQGGQAVFDFMWQVMLNRSVDPPQEVHDYFVDHQDLFEAGAGDEMTVTGTGLLDFYEANRVQGLFHWARLHKERIWGMLYGSRISPPRG